MKTKRIMKYMAVLSLAFITAIAYAQPTEQGVGTAEFGFEQGNGPSPNPGIGNGPSRGFGRGNGPAQGCRGGGFDKEKMFERIVQELGLTAEQQQLMKEQRAAHKAKAKETMEALKAKKQQLRQAIEKYRTDEGAVNALLDDIKRLMGAQLELRVEDALAMKKILTEEQYERFTQLIKRRGGKRQGMFRRGRQRGQGFQQYHQMN